METILKCSNLKKKFFQKQILKDISFEVNKGDILAFIGPNGSGKTTTIKLILGLNSIDSGEVIINGYNIKKDFSKAIEKVGAIVENPDSYMYLSGRKNLEMLARLYPDVSKEKIEEVIKLVGLEKRINDKVSKYSLGMRQRLGIAKSLLHNPNLLILDEPTNGLDPEGIRDLRIILKQLAKAGVGVLISSHNLAELESFCNKVCIIDNGKIIESSKVEEFKQIENKYIIELNDLTNLENLEISLLEDNKISFTGSKEEVALLIKELIIKDKLIYEVKQVELTLEEAFLNKTGGNVID